MRVLLSGATGLIGQSVQACLAADHQIVTLGRGEGAAVRVDLSDPSAVTCLTLPPIDAFVHCAGIVDEDFRDSPERALRMAVFGAGAAVERAIAAGAKQLVYISSAHAYGPMVGGIDEASPVNPMSDYAIAHFATEQVFARRASASLPVLILRPCAVFGDLAEAGRFRRWSLIPFSFPRDAVLTSRIVIKSTGEQRRNFVGSDDIAHQIAHWLADPGPGRTIRNAIGETSATVHAFAQMCAGLSERLTGKPCVIERVTPDGPTPGDDYDYRTLTPPNWPLQSLEAFAERLMAKLKEA
jgi:UDP-glucose 4-epimerase